MAAPAPPVNQIVAGNLIAFEKEEAGFNESEIGPISNSSPWMRASR
jgi:hypothetical protein